VLRVHSITLTKEREGKDFKHILAVTLAIDFSRIENQLRSVEIRRRLNSLL
jgi:hypothetical protein